MIRLVFIITLSLFLSFAQAEPTFEDMDAIEFKIGNSSVSGGDWCAWFPVFDWVGAEWSLNLPKGMSRETSIWFCDRVKITATDALDFLKVFKSRYQGCLDIEINGRPDIKEITVKMGPQMVVGRRNESASYRLVKANGEEVEVATNSFEGGLSYMCAFDINNAPDKEDGTYKIFEAARSAKVSE